MEQEKAMKKRISLIIPAFNCAKYLDETLMSVLNQLPDDCELIVVDDGSADETPDMLRRYADRYAGLRAAFRENGGVSSARNTGLDMATGEWIAFMDCDDVLKEGFFKRALALPDNETDLVIFSFERVELMGEDELVAPLMVADRQYNTVSDFADEYVRTRHLLVYSVCNKLYRKEIIDKNNIRFKEGLSFGEDRLFNYSYLRCCRGVATSSVRMFRYMQRNPESASKRSFPDYFNTIMMLHKAKTDCFLELSGGTTRTEKRAFVGYDLSTEMSRMIDRFDNYPEEKEENLPKINRLLFGDTDDTGGKYDYLIVLGSRNCGYRAERAFEIAGNEPDTLFIVTGGNMHKDGEHTEAGFMAELLKKRGVSEDRIIIEDEAENTFRNLEISAGIIEKIISSGAQSKTSGVMRIGIVTAGFHIPRTRMMTEDIPWYTDKDLVFIPAYGEHTRPDNWYSDPQGRNIGLSEIAKCCRLGDIG